MRRRHLRGVMAIERQVYPRPWSPNLFLSEMNESRNRCYLVARIDREVVGYGGLICYGEEAHVTNVAVDPLQHRRRIGSRILHDLIAGRPGHGGGGRLARGPGHELGRAAALRRGSGSGRSASARTTTRRSTRTRSSCGSTAISTPESRVAG